MIDSFRSLLQRGVYAWRRFLWSILANLRHSDRLWGLIDATGIVVFVGPNGSGKSLAGVHSLLRTLDGDLRWDCADLSHHHNESTRLHAAGCDECPDPATVRGGVGLCEVGSGLLDASRSGSRLVYSTVPLLGEDGEPHRLFRPLTDFRQLVTIEHSEVFFDEVAGIADASDSAAIPVQVTNWLHQLRKRDVRLRVTTPAYARCAKPIRQAAMLVVDCRSFFPELTTDGRLWRPRQAMLFDAFDAFEFADYTPSTGDRIKRKAGAAFWRPGCAAQSRYDTLGAVLALGHVSEGGMCGVCGGSRSRPRCGCDSSVDDVPLERLRIEDKVSAAGARTRRAVVVEGVTVQAADARVPVMVPDGHNCPDEVGVA